MKEAVLVVTKSVRAVVKRERKNKGEIQNTAPLIKQCSVLTFNVFLPRVSCMLMSKEQEKK